jgi:NitT/TauT family transport system permease protein
MTGRLAPIAALVLALVAWELIERFIAAAHPAVPAPSSIADAFVRSGRVLWLNVQPTVFEAGFGFAFGSLAGVALAILLFAWSSAEAALFKIVVTIHSIPLLAVAPLLVIWFGAGSTAGRRSGCTGVLLCDHRERASGAASRGLGQS